MGKVFLEGITEQEFISMVSQAVSDVLARERMANEAKNQAAIEPPPTHLTRQQAAEKLGCSTSTIDNYIRQGILTKRVAANGRSVRVLAGEVNRLI